MLPFQKVDPELIRACLLLMPVILLILTFLIRKPSNKEATGVLLGVLWNIPFLFGLNMLAEKMGWWHFYSEQHNFYAVPVDIVLGWAFFWGGFCPYLFRTVKLYLVMPLLMLFDYLLMPKLTMIFQLGDQWMVGEVILLFTCYLPGALLFHLTAKQTMLPLRAWLQAIGWGGYILFLIPAVVFKHENIDVFSVVDQGGWRLALLVNGLAFACFLGVAAVNEFITVGEGTPIPFDPPKNLVTTGPYAYLANPLQVSTLLMLIIIAIAYKSVLMVVPILVLFVFVEGIVRWHQQSDISVRFGDEWTRYKFAVHDWIPRWKPYIHHHSSIYFSMECGMCVKTMQWLLKLGCHGLNIISADEHKTKDLERVTFHHYVNDKMEEGVSAIARCFEHINLWFAMLGWFIRLPLSKQLSQLIVDLSVVQGDKVTRKNKS